MIHVVRKEFSESCCRGRIVFLHSVKTYIVSKEDIFKHGQHMCGTRGCRSGHLSEIKKNTVNVKNTMNVK